MGLKYISVIDKFTLDKYVKEEDDLLGNHSIFRLDISC